MARGPHRKGQRKPKGRRRAPSRLRHLAQCARGLEAVLAEELRALGSRSVTVVPGGALFAADAALAARTLLWSRTAVRVLEPVLTGRVHDPDTLYELASTPRWEELVGRSHTFAVAATLSRSRLKDRNFAALRVKDAIVDRIRDRLGSRPDVDRDDPDVPIRLIVRDHDAHLFRDLAGSSLHRRGYRPVQVRSPLPETTAAGLLELLGWAPEATLVDPMCGSGTFVLEAATRLADRAPGLGRSFAAERFPGAATKLWAQLREEAADRFRIREAAPLLAGSDVHPGAVGIARQAARQAGVDRLVRFKVADAADAEPPGPIDFVAANPPWGGRLGEGDVADGEGPEAAWRALGTFLRRCPGARAGVLSGSPEWSRHLGLRADQRHPISVGPWDARWLLYSIRESPVRGSEPAAAAAPQPDTTDDD